VVVAAIGLLFIAAVLLSLVRLHQLRVATLRDVLFLIGLAVVFVIQMIEGIGLIADPANSGDVNTIAILVVCCFFIGIARSWQLVGGRRSASGVRSSRSSGTVITPRNRGTSSRQYRHHDLARPGIWARTSARRARRVRRAREDMANE
jgi:hypothetical protein